MLANLWINVPFNVVRYAIPAITILGSHGEHKAIGVSIMFALALAFSSGPVPFRRRPHWLDDARRSHDRLWSAVRLCVYHRPLSAVPLLAPHSVLCNDDVVQSATITSLVGMALSVALNHLFIYGVGDSWSGFGFIGSPLATVVSSYYKYVQVVLLCF